MINSRKKLPTSNHAASLRKSPRKKLSKEEQDKGRRKLDFKTTKKDESNKKQHFAGKVFYLDAVAQPKDCTIRKRIQQLGGIVEEFFSRDIYMVITSTRIPPLQNDGACGSSSMQIPSPACQLQSPFSNTTDFSPQPSVDANGKPLKPVHVSRAKGILTQVLTTKKGSGTVVEKARKLGIKILSVEDFMRKYYSRRKSGEEKLEEKDEKKSLHMLKTNRIRTISDVKVTKLSDPCYKIEDHSKLFRPLHYELKNWPKICYETTKYQSPFDVAQDQSKRSKEKHVVVEEGEEDETMSCLEQSISSHKDTAEEASPDKKMEKKRKCKEKQKQAGYCDCCCIRYDDLDQHLKSDQHRSFCRDSSNFKDLDKLINDGPDFHDFLTRLDEFLQKNPPADLPIADIKKNDTEKNNKTIKDETKTSQGGSKKENLHRSGDIPQPSIVQGNVIKEELVMTSSSTPKKSPKIKESSTKEVPEPSTLTEINKNVKNISEMQEKQRNCALNNLSASCLKETTNQLSAVAVTESSQNIANDSPVIQRKVRRKRTRLRSRSSQISSQVVILAEKQDCDFADILQESNEVLNDIQQQTDKIALKNTINENDVKVSKRNEETIVVDVDSEISFNTPINDSQNILQQQDVTPNDIVNKKSKNKKKIHHKQVVTTICPLSSEDVEKHVELSNFLSNNCRNEELGEEQQENNALNKSNTQGDSVKDVKNNEIKVAAEPSTKTLNDNVHSLDEGRLITVEDEQYHVLLNELDQDSSEGKCLLGFNPDLSAAYCEPDSCPNVDDHNSSKVSQVHDSNNQSFVCEKERKDEEKERRNNTKVINDHDDIIVETNNTFGQANEDNIEIENLFSDIEDKKLEINEIAKNLSFSSPVCLESLKSADAIVKDLTKCSTPSTKNAKRKSVNKGKSGTKHNAVQLFQDDANEPSEVALEVRNSKYSINLEPCRKLSGVDENILGYEDGSAGVSHSVKRKKSVVKSPVQERKRSRTEYNMYEIFPDQSSHEETDVENNNDVFSNSKADYTLTSESLYESNDKKVGIKIKKDYREVLSSGLYDRLKHRGRCASLAAANSLKQLSSLSSSPTRRCSRKRSESISSNCSIKSLHNDLSNNANTNSSPKIKKSNDHSNKCNNIATNSNKGSALHRRNSDIAATTKYNTHNRPCRRAASDANDIIHKTFNVENEISNRAKRPSRVSAVIARNNINTIHDSVVSENRQLSDSDFSSPIRSRMKKQRDKPCKERKRITRQKSYSSPSFEEEDHLLNSPNKKIKSPVKQLKNVLKTISPYAQVRRVDNSYYLDKVSKENVKEIIPDDHTTHISKKKEHDTVLFIRSSKMKKKPLSASDVTTPTTNMHLKRTSEDSNVVRRTSPRKLKKSPFGPDATKSKAVQNDRDTFTFSNSPKRKK